MSSIDLGKNEAKDWRKIMEVKRTIKTENERWDIMGH